MSETPNPAESQSPLDLNRQLITLYGLLPDRDQRFRVVDEILRLVKPKEPVLKPLLIQRLKLLLDKAFIASSFKEVACGVFSDLCDIGVSKEEDGGFFYETIIVNSSGDAGIFEPNDAKRIERTAYHLNHSHELAALTETGEDLLRFRKGEWEDFAEDIASEYAIKFRTWRQEFIDMHHEEP